METEKNVTKVKLSNASDDNVIKVDLTKPAPTKEINETEETTADPAGMVGSDENTDPTEEQEAVQPEGEVQEAETPVLEEITDEEVEQTIDEVEEVIAEAKVTGNPLPDNIQKLVDFMEDTGGDISDYVNLNRDLTKLDDSEVLDEYYKSTKSHLSASERNFLLEDKFGFDEDVDDERTIRSKKIALKEQVAEAKAYIDGQKSKYYEEIKAGSKLTNEQQKAMDFFNRYNKESEETKQLAKTNKQVFDQKTNGLFNDKFKGFDYNVGDKKFRFNVKNVSDVKTKQSDLNNFVEKFLDKDSKMNDAAGYHKSLFTAMNPDAIAQHFYEQGKADAVKNSVAKDKNIDVNARQTHGEVNIGGLKVKVLGDDSNSFKYKIKRKK
jgi:hypothetical protein|tara:strand:+ start:935 stop:2074 length:1140 start_codon:yes stop_codon:yes gene_type:complete